MISEQMPFWLLFPIQTGLLYWIGCKIFGKTLGRDYDSIIHVWLPTTGAVAIAMIMGVPFWQDAPFGDAYDFGLVTFLMSSLSGRLSLKVRHEAIVFAASFENTKDQEADIR